MQPLKRQRKGSKAAAAAQPLPMQVEASTGTVSSSAASAPDGLPADSAQGMSGMAGGGSEAGAAGVSGGERPDAREGPAHPLSLEWLRAVPEDAAREYLMGVAGEGSLT